MPVYNAERFLGEAIESVLSQTYTDWELWVVDDCSTDGSSRIVRRYMERDARIHYLRTDEASGSPTLPRNRGIENARGRYIAFLDSDDVWLPHKLEEQLREFDDSQTAIVYSDYEKIGEEGKRENRVVKAPLSVDYRQLLLGNVIGCLTAVYDTEKVGKVYLSRHSHEDYILWLSILKQGYMARNTGRVAALYRVRKRSVSSNKLKALSWQWDIYIRIEKTGYVKGIYYFLNYACRAFLKTLK